MRAPVSRDQADAYRFGLRRLEAALVRGDAVPLHEQIRSQRRAALAGVVLGLLGLCGVAVYALIVPSPDWRSQAVVIGASSGSMYVVAHEPDRLVPVANLAAGRLVLAALHRGGATEADPATAVPVAVPDPTLDDAPRTPTAAVAGAVAVRSDAVVASRWAICDKVSDNGTLLATTVIGGTAPLPPAAAGEGTLLGTSDGSTWLVTAGHRHRVDTGDGRLLAELGLTRPVPRDAADVLVSALPEGAPLATPAVPGRGSPSPAGLPGSIGDVLATRPAAGDPQYVVVLGTGLQTVPRMVGGLLAVASTSRKVGTLDPALLGSATFVEDLQVDGWPTGAVHVLEPAATPVVCWTWSVDGPAAGEVWTGSALPLPAGGAPVVLAQADGAGPRVDAVVVGAGGVVRATGPGRGPGAGPLWMLSATGVGYGVADVATAQALGITAAEPAPEVALRLLPTGAPLDLAAAGRVVDVLPQS